MLAILEVKEMQVKIKTLCCLYFSRIAWKDPPLLAVYKSCKTRTHSFNSTDLYREHSYKSEVCYSQGY
ncbi:hypothetical protein JHK86_009045 [Glycine max]|nr:hypothetical protein JHK86_009045 [Glycine max]